MANHLGSGDGRIAVDFDDTLVERAWPKIGAWKPGAIEALRSLLDEGYEIVIHSTRLAPTETDEKTPRNPDEMEAELAEMRKLFDDAGLPEVQFWTKPWKPGALAYIDDKAVRYTGNPESWYIVTQYLLQEVLK